MNNPHHITSQMNTCHINIPYQYDFMGYETKASVVMVDSHFHNSRTDGIPLNGYDSHNGLLRKFRYLPPTHFLFTIESLSAVCHNSDVYESDVFDCGGFKWRLCLYPKGNQEKNIKESVSLYLKIEETKDWCKDWEVLVTFTFFIYDQFKDRFLTIQDGSLKRFHELKKEWGFDSLIPLKDFENIFNGFLVKDGCSFGTELHVIKHQGQRR